jgi:cellobiose transport system substrate-binding protein
MREHRRRTTAFVALLSASALLTAACSSGGAGNSSSSSSASANTAPVTLNVNLFGTFGYKESGLIDQYHTLHPNITINYTSIEQEGDYWPAFLTHLNAGSGVGDVQGVEVGRIAQVTSQLGDKFVDLNSTSAKASIGNFVSWKEKEATTPSGAVIGLGTDIGPMAICYRTDLLQTAGLPTDPTQLAAQMSTWKDYLALGAKYKAKAPANSAWTDSSGGLYSAILSQSQLQYYDASGTLIYATNSAVKDAWDMSVQAAQSGLTAKLAQFSDQWNQAFSTGSFATLACPSWMIGYIKGQAGTAGSGKWNVATLPGGKGGNWGGSYLAIPKASAHQAEAADLIAWLTAPEQQQKVFQQVGNFPSNTAAITAVASVTDPYFNNAPIGKIFGAAAEAAPIQTLGLHDGDVRTQITNGLTQVEAQGVAADKAWADIQAAVKSQVG